MMKPEEVKVVTEAYNKLILVEETGWSILDDLLETLDYLDDDQTHREADVLFSKETVHCINHEKHDPSKCLITIVCEATGYILELYKETSSLHKNNKYILQYYLALAQVQKMGGINAF